MHLKLILFRAKPFLAVYLGIVSYELITIFALLTAFSSNGLGATSLFNSIFQFFPQSNYPIVEDFLLYLLFSTIWYFVLSLIFSYFNKPGVPNRVKNIHWVDILLILILVAAQSYHSMLYSGRLTYLGSQPSPVLQNPFSSYSDRKQAYDEYYKTNFCPLEESSGLHPCYNITEEYDTATGLIPKVGSMLILSLNKNVYDESTIRLSKDGILAKDSFVPATVVMRGKDVSDSYWSQSYIVKANADIDITIQRLDHAKPFITHFTHR